MGEIHCRQAWLATSTVSTSFDISWQCTSATPDAWLSFNQLERESSYQQECLTNDTSLFYFRYSLWHYLVINIYNYNILARINLQLGDFPAIFDDTGGSPPLAPHLFLPEAAASSRPSNAGRCTSLPAVDTAMSPSSSWISKQIQLRPRCVGSGQCKDGGFCMENMVKSQEFMGNTGK